MRLLFVNVDDAYAQDVAVELKRSRADLAAVMTIDPEAAAERLGAGMELIDTRLLYRSETVRHAFPGIEPHVPSRQELVELFEAERHFTIATDRTTQVPIAARQRSRLFRELARHFSGWFAARPEVDTVLFESTPHMGWDIVLFHIAKLKRLKTLIVARTLLEDRILLVEDYRVPPGIMPDRITPAARLIDRLGSDFAGLIGGSNAWTRTSDVRNAASLREGRRSWPSRVWADARAGLYWWRSALRQPDGSAFESWRAGDDPTGFVPRPFAFARAMRDARALRRAYERHAIRPDLGRPYVYFAMHYQPERTSQPEALEYHDQWLAIATLAHVLPADWQLLVKEHPRQFSLASPAPNRRHARVPGDYDEIAALANVRLVAVDVPSAELIAKAQACATLTGSTGWESVIAGKPALIFGPAWYCECGSVFLVRGTADARKAFVAIAGLSAERVREDVLRFAVGLKQRTFVATTSRVFARSARHSYAELVQGLAEAVERTALGDEVKVP
jgi:hypothetical protein